MPQRAISAVYMRGGTSKGIFLRGESLPPAGRLRDELLLEIMGSPDPMQIDGMGGTFSSTSKVMAISPSTAPDCDIDYLFAQVAIERPSIDYRGNCGNLTAAVGPYALDEGMLGIIEGPLATVRLRNLNTGVRVIARFPVRDRRAEFEGDHYIDGVPRPGARIENEYLDLGGGMAGALLPTGKLRDRMEFDSRTIEVSFVDLTNPVAFVRAADVGLTGTELPTVLNADPALLARLERLRADCAVRLGFVDRPQDAALKAAAIPFLSLIVGPVSYATVDGGMLAADAMDLCARTLSVGKIHHACQITTLMCTAVAARLPGSVVHDVARPVEGGVTRLGHAKGTAVAEVTTDGAGAATRIVSVKVTSTARRLMAGELYYRARDGGI